MNLLQTDTSPAILRYLNIRALLLTPRGALLLIFALLLISGPALNQHDIVALVLGISLLAVCAIFIICCLLATGSLKKNLQVRFEHAEHDLNENLYSKKKQIFLLGFEALKIFPVFTLKIQPVFKKGGLKLEPLVLAGSYPKIHHSWEATFPHRGRWEIDTLKCELSDRLRLTLFSWDFPLNQHSAKFDIHPPRLSESPFPAITSAQREGDAIPEPTTHSGDLYEMKPYHPSDGMKKILWKVYARSGELLSRHPEQAMTPEGRVMIFVLAKQFDDSTCSAAISYAEKLESLNMDIFASTTGRPAQEALRSARNLEEELIDVTWDNAQHSATAVTAEVSEFINQFNSGTSGIRVTSCAVFISEQYFNDDSSIESATALLNTLKDAGVEPVVFIVAGEKVVQRRQKQSSRLGNWFLTSPEESEQNVSAKLRRFDQFAGWCGQLGLQTNTARIVS